MSDDKIFQFTMTCVHDSLYDSIEKIMKEQENLDLNVFLKSVFMVCNDIANRKSLKVIDGIELINIFNRINSENIYKYAEKGYDVCIYHDGKFIEGRYEDLKDSIRGPHTEKYHRTMKFEKLLREEEKNEK